MSQKTLKLCDVQVNEKEFHTSKKVTALNLIDTNQIVPSDKFKHNDKGSKYFIGCEDNHIIRSSWIVLPQMSGYIKYFKNEGKDMSFKIDDGNVLINCN